MAGKRRHGVVINLDERRRRRREDNLAEANQRMIEAEHALFVALRLAGHRGPNQNGKGKRQPAPTIVPLSRIRSRRNKAA